MRLIDADALAIMSGLKPDEWNTPDERWRPESEFGLWIINAPTIEPKRGRWITDGLLPTTCSECGHIWEGFRFRGGNYCPNCGAKMQNE